MDDLLIAEIREEQPRSVKYQMTIAKLPPAKELETFDFYAAEVNVTLMRDIASGDFLDHRRNLVLTGDTDTGTGKTNPLPGRRCLHRRKGRCRPRPSLHRAWRKAENPQARRSFAKCRLRSDGLAKRKRGNIGCRNGNLTPCGE